MKRRRTRTKKWRKKSKTTDRNYWQWNWREWTPSEASPPKARTPQLRRPKSTTSTTHSVPAPPPCLSHSPGEPGLPRQLILRCGVGKPVQNANLTGETRWSRCHPRRDTTHKTLEPWVARRLTSARCCCLLAKRSQLAQQPV